MILFNYHIIYSKMNNINTTLIRGMLTTLFAVIIYYILQIIVSLEKRLDEINKELKENIENEKITIATLEKRLDEINKELEKNIENEKRTIMTLEARLDEINKELEENIENEKRTIITLEERFMRLKSGP